MTPSNARMASLFPSVRSRRSSTPCCSKSWVCENEDLPDQMDRSRWPELRARFAEVIKGKTRDEWVAIMGDSDVCFAPIMSMSEAHTHPHNIARENFVEVAGVTQPAPAPKFSRTPGRIHSAPSKPGEHTESALEAWGLSADDITALKASGAVGRKEG